MQYLEFPQQNRAKEEVPEAKYCLIIYSRLEFMSSDKPSMFPDVLVSFIKHNWRKSSHAAEVAAGVSHRQLQQRAALLFTATDRCQTTQGNVKASQMGLQPCRAIWRVRGVRVLPNVLAIVGMNYPRA